jgi:pyruvate kinase
MMDRIIEHTERDQAYRSIITALQPDIEATAAHAVAAAAADVANTIKAAAIVAYTFSGTTATRIARKRPEVDIVTLTPSALVSRQLCLLWGAHTVQSDDVQTYEQMVEHARELALREEFAKPGERIVVVAGVPFGQAGTTNNLRVVTV